MQPLDPLTVPLEGINLIEASAGTGKTYTIATLFIRLILKSVRIDKILVVTFTNPATEELRDRIRQRLRETLTAFQQGHSQDKVLIQLLKDYSNHEDAIKFLKNALRGFDEAAIYTIHSFCRKMLYDHAFESGVLFDAELIKDQAPLLREVVEDFWRLHFYEASPAFISYALENGCRNPTDLLNMLNKGQYVGQPFLKIIPDGTDHLALTTLEQQFMQAFAQAQQLWQTQGKEIQSLLGQYIDNEQISGKKYQRRWLTSWFSKLDDFFDTMVLSGGLLECLNRFTTTELNSQVKKGCEPLKNPFFDLCGQLCTLYPHFEPRLLALKVNFFKVAAEQLRRKKRQRHVQSFDDLLNNLYTALIGVNAETLVESIGKKYQAALIDEFQDTDPVQYHIFRTLYGTDKHTLFLIGDPKQAIYSFRGADIFTYITARDDAKENQHTLLINWRSEATLIQAVNALFDMERVKNPFLQKIPFYPAQAPNNYSGKLTLHLPNEQSAPLQLWFFSREYAGCYQEDKIIIKTWANQHIPQTIAHEIVHLLRLGQEGKALIGQQPVVAGDIAILVRKNIQAQLIQKTLIKFRIPSVLYSRARLFESHEIQEIERVLLAIANPSEEAFIKAALTTDMLGLSGDALYELMENPQRWHLQLESFQKYNYKWKNYSFIQMFRELLVKEQIPQRLLAYADGERRLTNVLHAAEVLQQASVQHKLVMNSLCIWLAQQRVEENDEEESESKERQLRLESDEKRVKIVTIHHSKGLEYPIVFCPFAWDGGSRIGKAKHFTFHQESSPDEKNCNGKLQHFLDLGSENQEKHREFAEVEERAENLRLLYVAVTRAKHRCYVAWGAFQDAEKSALAHTLHPEINGEMPSDEQLLQELGNLEKKAKPALKVSKLPLFYDYKDRQECLAFSPTEELHCRQFSGEIDKTWKVSSFTALSRSQNNDIGDSRDYDGGIMNGQDAFVPPSEENSIFNFPRGAQAGMFMHVLFEKLDFTQSDQKIVKEHIERQLQLYGYEVDTWYATIHQWIQYVLHTPLEPQRQDFTLSNISLDKRLNELEFYYPLQSITLDGLQAIFAECSDDVPALLQESMENLEFPPLQGFMKGFIDMVFEFAGRFYIVDYKSTLLGTYIDPYHHDKLNAIMAREGYFLQYHIYTVALHRYLASRVQGYDYEKHFGGVYYLFLRGMRPQWGAMFGIFRDLPTVKLIQRLSQYFYGVEI